jgi:tetratricopeptide (TPR) repeat protein
MSLIFEALRQPHAGGRPPAVRPPASAPQAVHVHRGWPLRAIAVTALLTAALVGGLGMVLDAQRQPVSLPWEQAAPLPQAQVTSVASPPEAVPAPAVAVPPPVAPPALVQPALPVSVPVPVTADAPLPAAPSSPAPAPSAAAAPAVAIEISVQPQPLNAAQTFARFLQFVDSGELDKAQQESAKMASVLGEEHVLALRSAAYLAYVQAQWPEARQLYTRIMKQFPEDRESGLNLVRVEEQLGNIQEGLQLTARLLEVYPNDIQLRAARARLAQP